MYDLIGDIHGHAAELKSLLERLGYRREDGAWRHEGRTAVFLGDFIDRGPAIGETLQIVREMIDAGVARAVIGNHEINALAYATPWDPAVTDQPEAFCRVHSEKNRRQHAETLRQLDAASLTAALDWFRTLPLWIDLGPIRVVHACWAEEAFSVLRPLLAGAGSLTPDVVRTLHREGTAPYRAMELVLKGPELRLPDGFSTIDKEGTTRRRIRTRWFEAPSEWTYAALALPPNPALPNTVIPLESRGRLPWYPPAAPPVFVGHYWMPGDQESPKPWASNVACLDWSVAAGGRLVAYRWDGERVLHPDKFVSVASGAPGPGASRRRMPA